MSKASIMLRLLGAFTVEVHAGRTLAVALRSRKARALIAYLAMKPDGRARREELATLLWGDTTDAQARHSLRQCVMSLRQDLHLVAADLIDADRDMVELRMDALAVDARELVSRAASADADALARAAELWRGPFLADLALDLEEFDAWRAREQDRLAASAARTFEALCACADAERDGARALAAVERLVALDPTREDRQRTALTICARYRGREAALDRARQLTELLRSELAVAPDAETRTLIAAIRGGEVAPVQPVTLPVATVPAEAGPVPGTALVRITPSQPVSTRTQLPSRPVWRRRPIAAALALASVVSLGTVAALELAAGLPIPVSRLPFTARTPVLPGVARLVVLPFAVDAPRGDDQALARRITHDLTAVLARFGDLRVVADSTADRYRDRDVDVAAVGAELGVPYAVVGRVQRTENGVRADVQLIDAATRMALWSDHLQSDGGDATRSAEEVARGLARVIELRLFTIEAGRTIAAARRGRDPAQAEPIADLLLRAHMAEMRGAAHANLAAARQLYEDALRREPHNAGAMLGVARTNIIGTMNFIDLDPPPDLKRAEGLLNEVVTRFPQWAGAHFTLGLLQKYHRQYAASLQSFQRCLELNPSFLSAQAQIGNVLTRMGQPDKGLAAVQEFIRLSTPSDPSLGFAYLFAGEAELELGHEQAALGWVLRANSLMPNAPLVQAWIAGVYADMGDRPNATKYAAVLKSLAPSVVQRFATGTRNPAAAEHAPRRRIIEGLRIALAGPLG
ncbi:MAG TPA: BTAD domain-containing putative transcriptional regulator [Xanthobacteraceae bacterium]|nr:BTAD domain-containing putative transcriptional regulator [Xanthobacteraceae bacterium]